MKNLLQYAVGFTVCLAACEALAQTTIAYTGTFWSTALNQGGTVQLTMTFWQEDSVSGFVDNDNYPGENLLCGSGNFTGLVVGDSLFYQYPSFDVDPGCGFDWGIVTYHRALFHNGLDSISGAYSIDPTPGVAGAGFFYLSGADLTTPVDEDALLGFMVRPNPTHGVIHVSRPNAQNAARIEIRDVLGRAIRSMVLPIGEVQCGVDLAAEPPGIYSILLQDLTGAALHRVVLQR